MIFSIQGSFGTSVLVSFHGKPAQLPGKIGHGPVGDHRDTLSICNCNYVKTRNLSKAKNTRLHDYRERGTKEEGRRKRGEEKRGVKERGGTSETMKGSTFLRDVPGKVEDSLFRSVAACTQHNTRIIEYEYNFMC